jgi:phosphoglucosamine mutase
MREKRLTLGGEQSGHVIFLEHSTTGDGVLTALQLLSAVKRSGGMLSELAEQMQAAPQSLVNVRVQSKAWEANAHIQDVIATATETLGSEGRLFVRASGTEPLIRVMAEGADAELVENLAKRVAAIIKQELG